MISTDRKIFEENSAVRQRMVEYGNLVDDLHIIVFSKKTGFERRIIGNRTQVYSTNSINKFMYIFDAIRIGRKIIGSNLNRDKWLVTTQDPFETGLVGWFIAKTKKAKLHLQVHADFLSMKFQMASVLNKSRGQLATLLIMQADGVRVVSERIKNSISKWQIKKAEKISILPIFVDLEKIKNTQPKIDLHKKYSKFEFIILMASRLEKEKNIPLAMDVMKEIIKEYPKVGLVIVGDGSLRKSLELSALSYKLSASIVFAGWQDNLVSYYKTADLFLNTSNFEGYGMTLIEAAASGCPVLTTDVGLVGDVLKEGSVEICKVGNKKCFIKKLEEILNNKAKLKTMTLKAMEDIDSRIIKNKQDYLQLIKEDWERCFV